MELVMSANESLIVRLLQACEANDIEVVGLMLTANPHLIFTEIPGKSLSFILYAISVGRVNIVDTSFTAVRNSPSTVDFFTEHFLQQGGRSVDYVGSSLGNGSYDMLEIIQLHGSLLFPSEGSLLQFLHKALMYSIIKGNLVIIEFILDHYPALLDAPLYETLNESDREFLQSEALYLFDEETKNNPLLIATIKGHFDICKLLLSRGANVHFRNEDQAQAIHLGSMINQDEHTGHVLDILKLLVAYGADVNSSSNGGSCKYPLEYAVNRCDDEESDDIIRFLLSQGADLFREKTYTTYSGTSTVFIEYGCPVEGLSVNICYVSLFEEFGHNPTFLVSAREGQFDDDPLFTFRILCRTGFDWEPGDSNLQGKLLFKMLMSKCLAVLATEKKKKSQQEKSSSQNNNDSESNVETVKNIEERRIISPGNYLDIIYTLIEGQLSSAHQDGALLMKFAFDKQELEKPLFGILARATVDDFETKVETTYDKQNQLQKWYLLQCFIEYHNDLTITAIRYLLEQQEVDVDVAFTKVSKQTALMRICEQEIDEYSLPITECLIEHGAKVNLCDKDGKTPLHHLVENKSSQANNKGELPLFGLLLQVGADINQPDKRKQTPLALSKVKRNEVAERLFRNPPKKRKREEDTVSAK